EGAKLLDGSKGEPVGLVVVTETEIFGRQRQRRPSLNLRATAQRAQIDQLLDFSELVEGDFVVHLQHGIALYRGLTKLDTAQGVREVISLEFDDHVTLHVPLRESHLISRDVGCGKTEVAIRAAFKAVQGGRHVAILVPTTVLAQQHLNTFRERMAGYPIAVEMLSRFRTRSELQKILAATTAG